MIVGEGILPFVAEVSVVYVACRSIIVSYFSEKGKFLKEMTTALPTTGGCNDVEDKD